MQKFLISLLYTALNLKELLTSFALLDLTSCWWRPLLELIKEWTFLYTLGEVTVGWCKKPQISFTFDADTIHSTVCTLSSTGCNMNTSSVTVLRQFCSFSCEKAWSEQIKTSIRNINLNYRWYEQEFFRHFRPTFTGLRRLRNTLYLKQEIL